MQTKTLSGFQLSPQQKRLWLLQQDSSIYLTQGALLIKGHLNLEALRAALDQVVERYTILRTHFHRPAGRKFPAMVVADQATSSWHELDLRGQDGQANFTRVEKCLQTISRQAFDRERLPRWQLTLLKLSANQHVLHVRMPALCVDAWTLKLLTAAISHAYAACLKGESLDREGVPYLQFSEWQNQLLNDDEADSAREYWHHQMLPGWATRCLPFEHTAKPKGSSHLETFEPKRVSLTIASNLTTTLEAIAHQADTSLATLLLTCWQLLIWRLVGQPDAVLMGVAVDRRDYEELQDVAGLLATWLPIKTQLVPDLCFTEVIELVAQALDEAEEWQDYFVPKPEATDDAMVFPIGFEFAEVPSPYLTGDVSISLYQQSSVIEPFKVKLTCLQQEDSLKADFYYDSHHFSVAAVQRLAEHFQTLLAAVTAHPEIAISQLEILTPKERQHLLVSLNQTQVANSTAKGIHQRFEAQAITTPHEVAVVFEDYQLTYAELNARANQLAHYLQQLGVGPDTFVGLYLSRSLEMIVGLLGVLKAGGAYLPIEPTLPSEALNWRLQDAQISVLLTQQRLVETLLEPPRQVITLDTDWDTIAQHSQANPVSQVTSDNLAYVLFTSGSTGRPKGVEIEHRSLLNYVEAITPKLTPPTGANFATVSTFAADLGHTVIFPALVTGGCLHVISQARASDPAALAEYFHRYAMDYLKIVPSHLTALLAASSTESILPRHSLILGGEVASWGLVEQIQKRRPNCQILNHYGPTETTVGVLTYAIKPPSETGEPPLSETVPVGRPLSNTQVYVLDNQRQPVPMGIPGELYIGGAGVARGYLNRPELTTERFIANPFTEEIKKVADGIDTRSHLERLYKTGDLARYLPDGNLEFLGRSDHQVKVRGFRIELGEIETLLKQHPGVRDAIVLAREDEPGDKRLVAYFIPQPGKFSSVHELQLFLRKQLSEYMVPSAFVLLKDWPLTANGKIDRQSLPSPDTVRPDLEATFVAPRTPVEGAIAEIWTEVLRLEQVGVHDNFFDLGGHSLLVTQVVSRLRDAFEVDLSLNDFFETPTVANLAVLIAQKLAEETDEELLAQAFAELEQLSEEEVQTALAAAQEAPSNQEGGIQ